MILGILTGALSMGMFIATTPSENSHDHTDETHEHSDEVHVHTDFLIVVNDKPIDLTVDRFQAKAGETRPTEVHLHDNQGTIVHRHAEDITLVSFLTPSGSP